MANLCKKIKAARRSGCLEGIMEFLISAFLSLLSAGVTLFVYYKVRNTPLSKERLEKLYVPLFNMLEKDLFNYVRSVETDDKHIREAFQFMKENLTYADGKLIEYFYAFINETDPAKKKDQFDNVSDRIITMISLLSRKIGNGGLTTTFRYNHKLYIKNRRTLFEVKFVFQFYVLPFMAYIVLVILFLFIYQSMPLFK
jgi:hypothetical protein